MDPVKYRMHNPNLAPRRTRMEIPGWAGERQPRANGSHEQVWHCVPFSEGAQYGVELFYPYANELHVRNEAGKLIFDGDFGPAPDSGVDWPPFRNFGADFLHLPAAARSEGDRRALPFAPSRIRGFMPIARGRCRSPCPR